MEKLLGLAFFLVVGAVGVSADYYGQKGPDGAPLPFGQYLSERRALITEGAQKLLNPPSLKAAMPDKLAGWDVHRFTATDLAILTGAPPTKEQAEAFDNGAAMEGFGKMVTPGVSSRDLAYYKGDTSLRIRAVRLEAGSIATAALRMQASVESMIEDVNRGQARRFARIDGLTFVEKALGAEDDPALRRFEATLTDAIRISAITRSPDDAAILEALASIDVAMLNGLLPTPLPGIAPGAAELITEDTEQAARDAEEAQLAEIKAAEAAAQAQAEAEAPAEKPGLKKPERLKTVGALTDKVCVRRGADSSC